MDFKDFIPLLTGIVAILGIFYKREEVLSLRHKDFTARLDSTIRFFNEFYEVENQKKLILDRAAQDVAKSDLIDFKFLCFLIKLDEKFLIKLDEMVRLYKQGNDFIDYNYDKNEVNSNNFSLKVPNNRSVKRQIRLFNIQYFIYAFAVCIPFIFSSWFLDFFLKRTTPFIFIICISLFMFLGFCAAIISLLQASSLGQADQFIRKIKAADQQFNNNVS